MLTTRSGSRRARAIVTAAAAVALLVAPGVTAATAASDANPHTKITICHATGSEKKPWVVISPNANGVVSGHAGAHHQDARDIIPPFEYIDNGVLVSFAGQNWTESGQSTWANGCVQRVDIPN